MDLSNLLGQQIIIIAIMILIGFLSGKLKLTSVETSVHLSKTVLYVIAPCVFINAFQQEFSISKLKGFLFSLSIAIAAHALLIGMGILLKKIFKVNAISQASVVYTDCGNLLIPIITVRSHDKNPLSVRQKSQLEVILRLNTPD